MKHITTRHSSDIASILIGEAVLYLKDLGAMALTIGGDYIRYTVGRVAEADSL